MKGVLIIDDKQYSLPNIYGYSLTHSEDGGFTLVVETGVDTQPQEPVSEEDVLDKLIGEAVNQEGQPEQPSLPEQEREEPEQTTPPLTFEATPTPSPAPATGHAVHSAFNATSPAEPTGPKSRIKVSQEPPKGGQRPTFGGQASALIPPPSPAHAPQRPVVTTSAPSGNGILIPDKTSSLVGQKFPMQPDHFHILNSVRRDLLEEGGLVYGPEREKLKCLKSNVLVKSEPFNSMEEKALRVAMLSLVMAEQAITRGDDRENKLFLEIKPQLCVDAIADETAGTGVFHYEEMVSVYENPKTYRTLVADGKD